MSSGAGPSRGAGDGWTRRRFVGALAGAAAIAAAPACAGSREDPAGTTPRPKAPAAGPSSSASAPSSPASASASAPSSPTPASGPRRLFLGTYTSGNGGGKGIGVATYDAATGAVTGGGVVAGVDNPSFLAVHPDGRALYAVDEQNAGAVTAVRLPGTEVLGSRSTGGSGPCHLSVHPSGRWLLSANYASGSVAVHPIEASGALGERTDLVTHTSPPPGPGQQGPHAHQFVTAPDGGHLLAVDLGTDTVYTYRLDETRGTLTETSRARTRPGAGPRHLTFHPGGRYAYLANEADNTVAVCGYDPATGRLSVGEAQSTGTGGGTSYPAQFLVTPNGSYAFLANRGHNSLTRYAVEADGARLRLLDTVPVGGDFPRHIALSPDGRLLFAANQRSGTVTVFGVDQESGELRRAGEPFASPLAVCALPL
ncbi:lactonase family protein [Streptomyces sp. NPDC127077]|uniref:lactonase family protein n=1 Tax=Streptomyces sp. NPDC127077 TaxID=3347131 RepID=UPI00364A1BA9